MPWKNLSRTAIYSSNEKSPDSIWKTVDGIDIEFIGAFLTAHLSLEKYITDYLRLKYPNLCWDDARLTFSQKIALLQNEPAKPPYNEIFIKIKDFNNIRNKISHNLNYHLCEKDISKFLDFYKKIKGGDDREDFIDKDNPAELVGFFVMITQAYLASGITYFHSKANDDGVKK